MAAIRSRNTGPERLLRRALRASGIRGYRIHHPGLPGKPDIVFTHWRIAVFIDGAFWHGHPDHFTFGRLGDYWDLKIRRTQQRDIVQASALRTLGYQVIRLWDFEVRSDPRQCVTLIEEALKAAGRATGIHA
jgi:DNA mismatch endonuclease, patch repair protein